MNRLILTAALVLALCTAAQGQDFRVQFVEGLVEVQRGAAWLQVAAGDALPASAVVRVDEGALAELSRSGATLRVTRPGTYELARLSAASAQAQSIGVGTFLAQRARTLGSGAAPKATAAVGGVRAEAAGKQPEVVFVGGESAAELIAMGIDKLAAGAYKEAYHLFEDALNADPGPDAARAAFYLGYAAYLKGDVVAALRHLEKPRPDVASKHYADHVLVLAQLLVETFAYADAADLLQGYLAAGSPSGENLQTALLFLGLSQKGLGNRDRALESLRAAQRPDAASPAALAAARALQTL